MKLSLRPATALALALTISPFVGSAVRAQDMDVSKISCKEFISGTKDQIGTVLTWLEGYYTKENAPPILYADKTVKDAKALSEYCNAHPTDDLIKAAETVMPVK